MMKLSMDIFGCFKRFTVFLMSGGKENPERGAYECFLSQSHFEEAAGTRERERWGGGGGVRGI